MSWSLTGENRGAKLLTNLLIGYAPEGELRQLPARFPDVNFWFSPQPEEQCRLLAQCEAFICPGRAFSCGIAEACARSTTLRWIQMCSAGVEHVLDYNLPSRIRISRGGGLWNKPVAEHAMAMMLALTRCLPKAERDRIKRKWDFPGTLRRIDSLEGKRLLILGFGEIGSTLAQYAKALGVRAIGIRRCPQKNDDFEVRGLEEMDRLLPNADILAITLPGTTDTLHLVGDRELSLLPQGAILINVGRGSVVDTEALVGALASGHLGGAGLDVTDPEPCHGESPLWSFPNVVITPHVAGETPRWPQHVALMIERNLTQFLIGEPLAYEISRG